MPDRSSYIKIKRNNKGIKHFKQIKYPEIPYSINDLYVSTISGDRLDKLSYQFYENVDYWWVISIANSDIIRRDSFILEEGLEIRIPSDIQDILSNFKQLNK